eukprot:365753_1
MHLILEFTSTAFLSIWNGFLFTTLLIKLCKTAPDDRYFSRKIVWSALITFIGWFICYAVFTMIKLDIYFDWQLNSTLIIFLSIIFTFMYPTGFTSSYVFAISMLYASFNNTQFQMSKRTLYFHLFISILLFLLCTSGTFFLYVLPNKFGPILHALNFIVYITGLCSLYFALNMKLIKMVMMANEKSKIYIFNPIQASFMLTVTKLSVLQTIFTSTTIIYVLQSLCHHLIFHNIISEFTDWIVYVFTVCIGTSAIYLTFKMNVREYNLLCGCCNKSCKHCCHRTVKWLYLTDIWQTEMSTMRKNTIPTYVPKLTNNNVSVPSNSVNIQSKTGISHIRPPTLNINDGISAQSDVSTHSMETSMDTTHTNNVRLGEHIQIQNEHLNVIFETKDEIKFPHLTPASSLCNINDKSHEKTQSMLNGHNKTQSIVPIDENVININNFGISIVCDEIDELDDPTIDIDQ